MKYKRMHKIKADNLLLTAFVAAKSKRTLQIGGVCHVGTENLKTLSEITADKCNMYVVVQWLALDRLNGSNAGSDTPFQDGTGTLK
jgi:hypothetical protein